MGENRQQRGDQHGADTHRVDVVEVCALEFDLPRRQAQRLVDHQVRDQCADPGDGHVGVQPEHLLDGLEHAQLHQHQRDRHVEYQPDHPPRMAVGDACEEVRPGQGAGIGIGHVDLHLRDDDEQHHGAQRPFRRGEHVAEGHQVHLCRLGRLVYRDFVLQREKGEEGTGEHLQCAGDDPAGAGGEHRQPPAHAVLPGFLRQEAQVVDLLADLCDQCQRHGAGGAEGQQVERATVAFAAGETGQIAQCLGVLGDDEDVGQQQQDQPDRLRPELQAVDQGDAVGHQRHDDDRTDHIGECQRDAEIQLQRQRHDRRFEGEEQEGEAGVDQRGDGRADVAEAGATGQQVHVHAVARRVVTDRQPGEEDH